MLTFLKFSTRVASELCTTITELRNPTLTIYLLLPMSFTLPFYVFVMLISIFLLPLKELP